MGFDPALTAKLDRLVGTWRTEGRIVDGGPHDGDTWAGSDIYEWFPGRRLLVHRVDVHMFGVRREGLELFTPRAGSTDTFDQVSYDADGSVEHAVGSFDAEGRYHNDLEAVRATVAFDTADRMSAQWQMRHDDGSWADWMQVGFTLAGPAHIEVRTKDDHTV